MCAKKISIPLQVKPWGQYLPEYRLYFRPRQKPIKGEEEFGVLDISFLESVGLKEFSETVASWERLVIEFCSGHGHWIVKQAQMHPDIQWLAVEMKLSRAAKIVAKAQKAGLANLWVVCCEAKWFARHFLPSNCCSGVWIHFPDPWPKDRHTHHRLLDHFFLNQLGRIMKQDRELVMVSDDLNYCEKAVDLLHKHEEFQPKNIESPYQILQEEYGGSYFENLWRSLGRSIYQIVFVKERNKYE